MDILLSSVDDDFGLVPKDRVPEEAQRLANEYGVTVYARDPITDEVVGTYHPQPKKGA